MKFNPNARLDTSQVQDRRGGGGGGGGFGGGGGLSGIPGGKGGLAVGGGGLGLIVVIAIVLISQFAGGGASSGTAGLIEGASGNATVNNGQLENACKTGADASTSEDCATVAVINSVQDYWSDAFAASNSTYRNADTVFFSGSTRTGCGTGSAGMGPFYCPADQQVYIDLSFWDELRTTFGANDAPFTQAYVLAHEYGHHVQNLLGTSNRVGTATGATSGSVRLELQADCYAGVWAKNATTVPGPDGQVLITEITSADLANAIDTAGKIGDDYIQSKVSGQRVDPTQFSHGSSAQRQKWFTTGYQSGNPAACNTFDTNNLG
ncbi:MAG TPA: neutral zinc metallopeptidase [Nakamurella sp.]|jgi:predicted metalloprotease